LGFAAVAALLQRSLTALALLDPGFVAASSLLSGAIFVGAGAYQFSPLKQACVAVCRQPFPYLLANWSTEPGVVFRFGVSQGLHCVGCCWALMLVMLAVGVMNVVWMAGLGLIMAVEKLAGTARFTRAVGVVLIAIGAATMAASIVQRM
jgi:predicted metal-binding membrane protein